MEKVSWDIGQESMVSQPVPICLQDLSFRYSILQSMDESIWLKRLARYNALSLDSQNECQSDSSSTRFLESILYDRASHSRLSAKTISYTSIYSVGIESGCLVLIPRDSKISVPWAMLLNSNSRVKKRSGIYLFREMGLSMSRPISESMRYCLSSLMGRFYSDNSIFILCLKH